MPATGNALLAYNAQPSTRQVNNLLRRTEVGRGMFAPLVEYADGSIEPGLPEVINAPVRAIRNMLTPGYDYSNTDKAARDAFDASGFAMTGGLAANAAGLVPKGAVGSAGARMAAPASRTVDDLGFYSKLDEVLGLFGDKDQITAKAIQERGVKASEIEARGIAEVLAGGPRPAGDLRQVAQANPVEVSRSTYGPSRGIPEGKWQSYSLDPDNPTYRETVLHLPERHQRQIKAFQEMSDEAYTESGRLEDLAEAAAARGDEAEATRLFQASEDALDGIVTAQEGKESLNFQSGHWNEPNVIAHARTSMNTTPDGRKAFLIDELQSDWGQKLRDNGGARDGVDISGIQRAYDNAVRSIDELADPAALDEYAVKLTGEGMRSLPDHVRTNVRIAYASESGNQRLVELAEEASLREAELITHGAKQSSAIPGHPLVNTSDQWQTTAMRQLLKQAVDEGADVVAIPSGQTVESFGMGGKSEGLAYAYDQMYPKNMRKILSKMDKGIAPEHINALASASGRENLGQGFTLFPITDPVRQSVAQGQPLFANPTNALAPYLATQESKER